MAILYDTYFVVALAFVLFFVILWRFNVHHMVLGMLDARAETIRKELAEAARLRDEAQALLASYERKRREMEQIAVEIVAKAKEEAVLAANEAKRELAESIARRLKTADEQIAAAESAAVREVKDKAVAVAIAAASDVIASAMTDDAARARVDAAIDEIAVRLN
ncbi:MAG: ATP F0F1 synthase subunit B [Rhodobacteraceae bacterium]|nr:MAG: ATP F0F1 synthase subunit B [Paracoccaceae bacterium]